MKNILNMYRGQQIFNLNSNQKFQRITKIINHARWYLYMIISEQVANVWMKIGFFLKIVQICDAFDMTDC